MVVTADEEVADRTTNQSVSQVHPLLSTTKDVWMVLLDMVIVIAVELMIVDGEDLMRWSHHAATAASHIEVIMVANVIMEATEQLTNSSNADQLTSVSSRFTSVETTSKWEVIKALGVDQTLTER